MDIANSDKSTLSDNKKFLVPGIMYKIIITEKPSVARDYEKALQINKTKQTEGYIEGKSRLNGNDYRITWSIGHLVTLSYPEVYDEKLKKWDIDMLPFLPAQYKYETISNVRKQFGIVKKLYHDSDFDTIYYAGDSGREGIYIQMLIRMMTGHTKGIEERVVWIDSQTEDEIIKGIKDAKPLSAYQNKIHSAYMRAIEDYAMGINFSRALTCKYGRKFNNELSTDKYKSISVGRVMTCVLGMIVNRERQIKDFVETVFYKPGALCGDFIAKWKAIEGTILYNSPDIYNNEGFLKYSDATSFTQELSKRPELTVTKADIKIEKKQAPLLFNLAEIQNECAKLFKISPDETLSIIQALYEKKLVTYPRTDARVLTTAVSKEIANNLNGLRSMGILFADNILNQNWHVGLEKTKYCNDANVTDHYAIIPTGQGDNSSLAGLHQDVYNLIVNRFLSIFYPAAEYKKIDLELKHCENEYFFASEKVLKTRGYLEVLGEGEVKEDTKLMQIKTGDVIKADYNVTEGRTTPPKRYNSGNIILAMESAGNLIEDEELRAQIKSCGIGTSATRAEILKKLLANGYITLEKKTQILKPLIAGEKIYDIVDDTVPALLSPTMTASWEKGLAQIEEGMISREVYQQKLNTFITKEVDNIKHKEVADPAHDFVPEIVYKCPYCNKNIVTSYYGYKCEDYGKEEGKCSFYLSQISGKSISKDNLVKMLATGKSDIISGFVSKTGKKFDAMLKLDMSEKKIVFDFPQKVETTSDIECPKCGEKLKKGDYNFTCSCGLKIPHVIAKKKLTDNQVKELIAGRTGLIEEFTSKTNKKFAASLTFDGEKVSFLFPEKGN